MTARPGSSSATVMGRGSTWLTKMITRDDMDRGHTRDVLPGSTFTPDSKSIVITIGGKFAKVDVPSGTQSNIPFSADVDVPMGPLVRFEYPINDSAIQVRQIRGAAPSPDAETARVHGAGPAVDGGSRRLPGGGLHAEARDRGECRRALTCLVARRRVPRVGDVDGGRRRRHAHRSTKGGAKAERLTKQTAFYEDLNYIITGRRLVVVRGCGSSASSGRMSSRGGWQVMELVWLPGEWRRRDDDRTGEPVRASALHA